MIKCLKLAIKTIQKVGLKKKTSSKKNYLRKIVSHEGLKDYNAYKRSNTQ